RSHTSQEGVGVVACREFLVVRGLEGVESGRLAPLCRSALGCQLGLLPLQSRAPFCLVVMLPRLNHILECSNALEADGDHFRRKLRHAHGHSGRQSRSPLEHPGMSEEVNIPDLREEFRARTKLTGLRPMMNERLDKTKLIRPRFMVCG